MAATRLPEPPYVGLYGSHAGDWRRVCAGRLAATGVRWHDPADPRWRKVTPETGDALQPLIDELLAAEHRGLTGASCVILHLASRVRYHDPGSHREDEGRPLANHAARCELGFLAGRRILTFLVVDDDLEGRNYLWAHAALYPHVVCCADLDDACRRAVDHVRSG